MKISEIRKLNDGAKGIECEGKVTGIYEDKTYTFEGNPITYIPIRLSEGKEFVYVSLYKIPREEIVKFKGKEITLGHCSVRTYNSNKTKKLEWSLNCYAEVIGKEGIPEEHITREPIKEDGKVDWDGKEKRTLKNICLSYAKDLCVEGKIDIKDLFLKSTEMIDWIYNEIKWPEPITKETKSDEGISTIEKIKREIINIQKQCGVENRAISQTIIDITKGEKKLFKDLDISEAKQLLNWVASKLDQKLTDSDSILPEEKTNETIPF